VSATWQVWRRGRPSAGQRLLYDGTDEVKARTVYNAVRARMRQGELRLVDPAGKTTSYYSAPMCRTRW